MAPGTRSSKDSQASKASMSASNAAENQRSKHASDDSKPASGADGKENSATAQPLGPPPRPSQNNSDGPDYFGQVHSANIPAYQAEPNPFEAQFGNPSTETPGKLLPSVAALTSPSALLPNDTPGWNSLRSGPLSPAMLAGPAGDYFDAGYSRSFPTPNESGLRTGLTPGGGGSMFPAPSPNSQAIFNGLQLGAPTPNTLDFFKTARTATNNTAPTSQPPDVPSAQGLDLKLPDSQTPSESFAQHDADAANGLFMLAQSNGARTANQFAVPPQASGAVQPPPSNDTAPPQPQTRSHKNSLGSSTLNADDTSDSDESEEAVKPATRSRGKKQSESKASNNRRKATDTPAKTPSNKRQKANIQDRDRERDTGSLEPSPKGSKNMTDEEKRKNFLERNRVAALKCRQRKKQWLQNLQSKVDLYSQENDNLTHQCAQLREHILQLRQLLMTHKDCNVTVQQGLNPQTFMAYLTSGDTIGPYASVNGVSQPMTVMMADGRQVPTNGASVLPRS